VALRKSWVQVLLPRQHQMARNRDSSPRVLQKSKCSLSSWQSRRARKHAVTWSSWTAMKNCSQGAVRTLLVLNLCLHIVNGVGMLHFESDSLTCQSLHENLHCERMSWRNKCNFRVYRSARKEKQAATISILVYFYGTTVTSTQLRATLHGFGDLLEYSQWPRLSNGRHRCPSA
jgi:hypothetical protein